MINQASLPQLQDIEINTLCWVELVKHFTTIGGDDDKQHHCHNDDSANVMKCLLTISCVMKLQIHNNKSKESGIHI